MGSGRYVMTAVLLAATAGCAGAEDTTSPPLRREAPDAQLKAIYSSQDPEVGVHVAGRGQTTSDWIMPHEAGQPFTYTAVVSGGTGPYTYHWSSRMCFWIDERREEDCQREYGTVTEGQGVNSVTWQFDLIMTKVFMIVEVREAGTGYTTGVDSIQVLGPQFMQPDLPGSQSGTFSCMRSPNWYPFDEWKYVTNPNGSNEWVPSGRVYTRDACTGSRIFDPARPDTVKRLGVY